MSSTVPVAPVAGALRVIVGAVEGLASWPAALRTTAEPAGTVRVIFLSASDLTVPSVA